MSHSPYLCRDPFNDVMWSECKCGWKSAKYPGCFKPVPDSLDGEAARHVRPSPLVGPYWNTP